LRLTRGVRSRSLAAVALGPEERVIAPWVRKLSIGLDEDRTSRCIATVAERNGA
jgi:hypothetical protein